MEVRRLVGHARGCRKDTDQARLGISSIQTHCDLNRWQALEIQKNIVRNPSTGSQLEILSSDAASGYGQLVDAICIDEIGNWADTDSSQRLWEMIISTATKKDNCIVESITNSGYVDSFSWKIREAVREDTENWCFQSVRETPRWITEKKLAEQRRLLPAHVYRRLWENTWVTGGEGGIDASDIEACKVLDRPPPWRLVSHKLSMLQRRQTDTFRPGSVGCRFEIDFHFALTQ